MHLLVYGPGRLGSAITAAARAAGWATTSLGREDVADARTAPGADVVVDASRGEGIVANVAHALAGGNRRLLLATTGWDVETARVRAMLLEAGAAAVVAPNLSLGAALFLRLAEAAAAWYAAAGAFEPSIVEWHRSGKADRPSGTARAIARRIVAADPRWLAPDANGVPAGADHGIAAGPGLVAGAARPIEIVGVRAGAAPGTHLVTFDGPGESVELRLTARDRTAYADGALAAARWLLAEPREPGLHPFDTVVDDLLQPGRIAVPA